jgi:MarR family transcriptional regulator, organic hydroperoxide resistance regulator
MRTTTDPDARAERERAAHEAFSSLGRAVGTLRCAGSQRLVRLGISMTHFHVLTLLRHHDAMPMGRLAEILDASMSSTTGIIDRMEEKGLVERVRVPDDRRIVLVRSTAAGLALIDEAELVKSEIIASAISRLDLEQLERLALASKDLGAAIASTLADNPGYDALARCDHAHGSVLGPTTSSVRASNLHDSRTPTPQSRDTIDVAPAQPAHTVARDEPALKEG